MNRAALVLVLLSCLLVGCLDAGTCPAEEGYTACGVCSDTGRCVYCAQGETCATDICGTPECIAPRITTTLFQLVNGQPVPGSASPAGSEYGYSYESWIVITDENGAPLEGYTYSVEDPSSLPPGLTLSSDGKLSGLPSKPGDYVFGVCATSPAGQRTCRDVPMHVSAPSVPSPHASPSASPSPEPSETPEQPATCGDVTVLETEPYDTVLWMHTEDNMCPYEDCSMEMEYTFNIKFNGTAVSGTVTSTKLRLEDCPSSMSAYAGQTLIEPITGTREGCVLKFSTQAEMSATDYTMTLKPASNFDFGLSIKTCHSPDERCTCYTPDPRCSEIEQAGYPGEGAISTQCWWETSD